MNGNARFLYYVRLTHRYFGLFCAPAILFFAFSGSLQLFSLHETTQGSRYKPPAWAMELAQIHKKQTTVMPPKKMQGDRQGGGHAVAAGALSPLPKLNTSALPLKFFFLVVAVGLMMSTITGIYMGYKFSRNVLLVTGILVAGAVVPVLLAMMAK